jgi:hypothetical protein
LTLAAPQLRLIQVVRRQPFSPDQMPIVNRNIPGRVAVVDDQGFSRSATEFAVDLAR